MVNPRQARKRKSGTYKPARTTNSRKLRKTPAINAPKAIRDAWNKNKSLHQNYAALGLASGHRSLPKGRALDVLPPPQAAEPSSSNSAAHSGPETIISKDVPKGHARIIRDADGNVVRIEEAEEDQVPGDDAALEDALLNSDDDDDDDEVAEETPVISEPTPVVKALEERAAMWGKAKRPSSASEVKWLVQLVHKHGSDVSSMHMDRKLNPWQRTPGELNRAIAKAGGLGRLKTMAQD